MKNKILVLTLLLTITIPQIASASWWNPFSWRIFNKIFGPKDAITQEIVLNEEIIPEEVKDEENEESEIEKLKAEIEELKREKNEVVQKPTSSTAQTPTKQNDTSTVSNPAPVPTSQVTTKTLSRDEMYNNILQKYKDFQSIIANEKGGLIKNSSLSIERTYFNFLDGMLNKVNSDLGYLESIRYWNPRPSDIENVYLEKFNKLKGDYDIQSRTYNADIKAEQQRSYYNEALIRLNSIISHGEIFKEWLNDTNNQLRSSIMLIANKPLNVGLAGECRSASIDLGNSLREYISSKTFSVQEDITKWKMLKDTLNNNPLEFLNKGALDLIPTLDSVKNDYTTIRNKINESLNSVTDGMKC